MGVHMSDSTTSSGSRAAGVFHAIVLVALLIGVFLLIVGQSDLSKQVDAANANHKILNRELQTLRSEAEKQATTVNQIVSDRLGNMEIRLDQQTAGVDRAMKEHINAQNQSLAENFDTMETRLDQQTAVMHRALGKVIPVVMPPEWETRLVALEQRINDASKWPSNEKEAKGFADQLTSLIESVPVWAEADYLPRLTLVRWSALAFASMQQAMPTTTESDASTEALSDSAEFINSLISSAPDNAPDELLAKLQSTANNSTGRYQAAYRQAVLAKAQSYIEDRDGALSKATVDDLLDLYGQLGEIQDTATRNTDSSAASEIEKVREKLLKTATARRITEQANGLEARWTTIATIKDKRPEHYKLALAVFYQEIQSVQLMMLLDGHYNKRIDDLADKVRGTSLALSRQSDAEERTREEARFAKAKRDYNRWALKAIMDFEQRIADQDDIVKDVKQRIKEGNRSREEIVANYWDLPTAAMIIRETEYVPANSRWGSDQYLWGHATVTFESLWLGIPRDAMISHLLPIDEVLLERPVLERYQRAFANGWKLLDGNDHQTDVAKEVALVVKKPLREFLGGQP